MALDYFLAKFQRQAFKEIDPEISQLAYGLKDCETDEIIHVFRPDKGWTDAFSCARHFEADIVRCVVKGEYSQQYQVAVYMRKDNIRLEGLKGFEGLKKDPQEDINVREFKEYKIGEYAKRLYRDTVSTTFLGIMPHNPDFESIIDPYRVARGNHAIDWADTKAVEEYNRHQPEVFKVFPRGTRPDQIAQMALMFECDVVMVKVRINFRVTGIAKVEKKFRDLRQS